jgi:hypothetical protein
VASVSGACAHLPAGQQQAGEAAADASAGGRGYDADAAVVLEDPSFVTEPDAEDPLSEVLDEPLPSLEDDEPPSPDDDEEEDDEPFFDPVPERLSVL